LLLASLVVASCGGGVAISQTKAQGLLVGHAPTGEATVVSAKCPGGVRAAAEKSFDCQVRLSDGTTGTWTVHIQNSQGLVTTDGSDFTPNAPPPKPSASEVGQTKLVTTSGGVSLRVTLVAFTTKVNESSPDALTDIAGVQLRITNVGGSTYRDDAPREVSVLLMSNTAGADIPDNEQGPCGGSFYSTPLIVPAGATVEGCIPFEVPSRATVTSYKFTPEGEAGVAWSLG
jgi:hypothetical protein